MLPYSSALYSLWWTLVSDTICHHSLRSAISPLQYLRLNCHWSSSTSSSHRFLGRALLSTACIWLSSEPLGIILLCMQTTFPKHPYLLDFMNLTTSSSSISSLSSVIFNICHPSPTQTEPKILLIVILSNICKAFILLFLRVLCLWINDLYSLTLLPLFCSLDFNK